MRKRSFKLGLASLAIISISLAAIQLWSAATTVPEQFSVCHDIPTDNVYFPSDGSMFHECLQKSAKIFIDIDYAETKDLSKSFLTLLVAVFVASITFSEKIVGVGNLGIWSRGLMITCWVMLLSAIVCCGTALTFMTLALGWAAHVPDQNYYLYEFTAARLYIIAGILFGIGLASMLATGLVSLSPIPGRALRGPHTKEDAAANRSTSASPTQEGG
jgi:hypothetical protein